MTKKIKNGFPKGSLLEAAFKEGRKALTDFTYVIPPSSGSRQVLPLGKQTWHQLRPSCSIPLSLNSKRAWRQLRPFCSIPHPLCSKQALRSTLRLPCSIPRLLCSKQVFRSTSRLPCSIPHPLCNKRVSRSIPLWPCSTPLFPRNRLAF